MSDVTFEQLADAMADLNTALQDAFGRDGCRLFLLRRESQSKNFNVLSELTSGWRVEYGTTREEIFLYYSTIEDYGDTFAQTTYLAFGVPDAGNKIFVYEIQPSQKERTTPDFWSDDWKAFAVRMPFKRYILPNYVTFGGAYLTYNGDRLSYNP